MQPTKAALFTAPPGDAPPPPFPFPTAERAENDPESLTPDKPARVLPVDEASIDHGVEESFPASDPVSVSITRLPD